MLPANQFGHRHLVAVRFKLQAAQGVGKLAAEFTGMQRVAPEFRQGCFRKRGILVPAQHGGHFGLATGNQHDEPGLLVQGKADGVIGGRVAGVQCCDDVDARGQGG